MESICTMEARSGKVIEVAVEVETAKKNSTAITVRIEGSTAEKRSSRRGRAQTQIDVP
jgi:hypothetical protein